MRRRRLASLVTVLVSAAASNAQPQTAARARDLGIPFDGVSGPFNVITDVPGVLTEAVSTRSRTTRSAQ